MSESRSQTRIARLREARRASGMQETNIWLTREVRQAIGQAVQAGRFPNQAAAIQHALERAFEENKMT